MGDYIILLSVLAVAVNGLLYDPKECKKSREGAEYMGTVNTASGIECQRWDSQEPHDHPFTDPKRYPDRDLDAAANYCRNPDLEAGPWCYTTDPDVRWTYCDIPVCDDVYPDCAVSGKGDYFGSISETKSGQTCRNWDEMTEVQEKSLIGVSLGKVDGNRCRNPDDKEKGPWCFVGAGVTDWEYCAISFCKPSPSCTRTPEATEYVGKRGITLSGRPCQRWDRQTPHTHSYTDDAMFPDLTVTEAENFCRNPDNSRSGLWCYTTDNQMEWELCDIAPCAGCKQTPDGREYMGTESTTATGFSCINWSETSLSDPNLFPDESMEGAANFCRNPDNKEGGVWCHTGPDDSQWEYCDVPLCETNCDRDSQERRTVKHVLHVGIDGLHADCWLNATGGLTNFMRMSTEGSFTYANARGELLTFSGPNWGSFVSGLGIEETGITSNDWEAPWNGFEEDITPVTGLNFPFPNVAYYLKGFDANIRTAAFYNWPWFYEMFSRGSPGSVDLDFYCRGTSSSGEACDWDLTGNVTEHMQRVVASAERSYTFVHLDSLDASGHANGWCSDGYLQTVDTIDLMIGEMLDSIEGHDVVFTLSSDHGGTPDGAHGRQEDEHLLIPIWFLGPGIKANYEIIGQVRNRDMVPTFLWSMGIPGSPHIVGDVVYEVFE